ncbi:hypothetical protein OT109_13865 [Phycisphaeraceae bacterium D3-23]
MRPFAAMLCCCVGATLGCAGHAADAPAEDAAELSFQIAAEPGDEHAAEVARLMESGPESDEDSERDWLPILDLVHYTDDEDRIGYVSEWLEESTDDDGPSAMAARESLVDFFEAHRGVVAAPYDGRMYLRVSAIPEGMMATGQGWSVLDARQQQDDLGRPSVVLRFDERGTELMSALSGKHVGRMMAVVLDGEVITSPRIHMRLGGAITLTGDYSQEEIDALLRALRGTD